LLKDQVRKQTIARLGHMAIEPTVVMHHPDPLIRGRIARTICRSQHVHRVERLVGIDLAVEVPATKLFDDASGARSQMRTPASRVNNEIKTLVSVIPAAAADRRIVRKRSRNASPQRIPNRLSPERDPCANVSRRRTPRDQAGVHFPLSRSDRY